MAVRWLSARIPATCDTRTLTTAIHSPVELQTAIPKSAHRHPRCRRPRPRRWSAARSCSSRCSLLLQVPQKQCRAILPRQTCRRCVELLSVVLLLPTCHAGLIFRSTRAFKRNQRKKGGRGVIPPQQLAIAHMPRIHCSIDSIPVLHMLQCEG